MAMEVLQVAAELAKQQNQNDCECKEEEKQKFSFCNFNFRKCLIHFCYLIIVVVCLAEMLKTIGEEGALHKILSQMKLLVLATNSTGSDILSLVPAPAAASVIGPACQGSGPADSI